MQQCVVKLVQVCLGRRYLGAWVCMQPEGLKKGLGFRVEGLGFRVEGSGFSA